MSQLIVGASRQLATWMALGPKCFRTQALSAVSIVDANATKAKAKPSHLWLECHKRALIWKHERENAKLKSVAVRHQQDVFGPLYAMYHHGSMSNLLVPGLAISLPSFLVLPLGPAAVTVMATSTLGFLWLVSKVTGCERQLCDDNAAMWQAVARDVSRVLGVPFVLKDDRRKSMDADWGLALQHYADLRNKEEFIGGEGPWARQTADVTATAALAEDADAVLLATATLLSWEATQYSYKPFFACESTTSTLDSLFGRRA